MAVFHVAERKQSTRVVDGVTSGTDVLTITCDAGQQSEAGERCGVTYRTELVIDILKLVLRRDVDVALATFRHGVEEQCPHDGGNDGCHNA